MNVARVRFSGFMPGTAELVLPTRGVVLLTGPNGSGKSTWAEAVASAAWNETLRGARPWRDGEICRLEIATHDGLHIDRTRRAKGTQKLSFWRGNETPAVWESTAKAQEALECEVGSFDVWRRAHVFSSEDAQHLSLATDAERKRLLEAMLGLAAFDDAMLACRVDSEAAAVELGKRVEASARAGAEVDAARRVLNEAEGWLAQLDSGSPAPMLDGLAQEIAVVFELAGVSAARQALNDADARAARVAIDAIDVEAEELRKEARQLREEAARVGEAGRWLANRAELLENGRCATCERDGAAQVEHETRTEARRLSVERMRLLDRAKVLDSEASHIVSDGRRAHREACAEVLRASEALEVLNSRDRRRTDAEADLVAARRSLLVSERVQATATGLQVVAQREHLTLRAVEAVLGLRGPRAAVLSSALQGVTEAANGWLARLGGGISVELLPYTETRKGGQNGAISIKVRGAGGGEGYRACSAGERRRIDVAVLFGLGEMVAGLRPTAGPGTMWLDEVLDHGIDAAGVPHAVDAVHAVAADRCVVVISHREDLIAMLKPHKHVRMGWG